MDSDSDGYDTATAQDWVFRVCGGPLWIRPVIHSGNAQDDAVRSVPPRRWILHPVAQPSRRHLALAPRLNINRPKAVAARFETAQRHRLGAESAPTRRRPSLLDVRWRANDFGVDVRDVRPAERAVGRIGTHRPTRRRSARPLTQREFWERTAKCTARRSGGVSNRAASTTRCRLSRRKERV